MGQNAKQGNGNEYVDYNQVVNQILQVPGTESIHHAEKAKPAEVEPVPIMAPKPHPPPILVVSPRRATSTISPTSALSDPKTKAPVEEQKQPEQPLIPGVGSGLLQPRNFSPFPENLS